MRITITCGNCYHCGRALTRATPLASDLVLRAHCAEIITPGEQIGWRAAT
jgi:hypothetical protein